MSADFDHAAEARRQLEEAEHPAQPEPDRCIAIAQVHATLALVQATYAAGVHVGRR